MHTCNNMDDSQFSWMKEARQKSTYYMIPHPQNSRKCTIASSDRKHISGGLGVRSMGRREYKEAGGILGGDR